jgi:VCBS repeat protein
MECTKRNLTVVVALLTLTGASRLAVSASKPGGAFAPYREDARPQRASGDFDGDGRADVAGIQTRHGQPLLSVWLTGSPTDVQLDASVAAVVGDDVDRDGDLDLIAATTSGDVVIWLNDGHGHFTRQQPQQSRGLVREEPTAFQSNPTTPCSATATPPFFVSCDRTALIVLVASIRPPNGPPPFGLFAHASPTLRGPPLSL